MKRNREYRLIIGITALLLLLPLIAMQFTAEVNWTGFDFLVAAILLLATGFTAESIIRKIRTPKYKIMSVLSLIVVFLLLWIELAVGIL